MRYRRVAAAILLVLVACKKEQAASRVEGSGPPPLAEAAPRAGELTWQRAVMTGSDGSAVAFLLGLPPDGAGEAVVVSGTERTSGVVSRVGTALRVEFPIYFSTLLLEPSANGGFEGHYEIASPAWGDGRMPLRATPIAAPTLAALATLSDGAPIDLAEPRTVWRMKLGELAIKLVLDQRAPGEIDGTMFFDNGNVAYFGGSARGDRILLAGFEGASPFSLDVRIDVARRHVEGTWRAGHLLGWKEAIVGERARDFELGATIKLDGKPFSHPLLAGLDGKPVIVELAATWCSTCKNAAPTLRALYDRYHPAGLEMISLLYEFTTDPVSIKQAEALFREGHEITWPVRAVPGEQEDLLEMLPSGVVNVDVGGYPAVIFRRRDGRVVGIHAGFPAETTGAPHQATVAKFERLAAEVMK
jgi:thiol-disulfide isomerase/thioredoxin